VVTDVAAECRFSSYNRSFDAMTLVFESGDQLTHTYDISLSSYGYKTFYVLCKDDSGNVGKSAKITFNYKSLAPDNPVITPKADTTAPVIDPASLAPTGTVTATPAILTVKTDEAATCKYDVTDISYDTMANTFDPATDGTTYTKSVVLGDAGPYVYYIRCKDAAGNADTASSQITFTYTKAQAPVISGTQPTNNSNVYQSQVGLQVNTDVASDCRYSTADMDYDAMQDGFNTSDNLLHQANVNLNNVGPYIYYVRCKSKDGAKNDTSTVINFQYEVQTTGDQTTTSPPSATVTMGTSDGKCNMAQDNICDPDCPAAPDPGADPDCANLPQTTQSGQTPTITMGVKDGECNNAQDYVCDPDCPPAPDSDADPDCANIKKSGGGVALVLLIIGILVIVAIVAVVIILKKRGAEEESIETLE
jgi:hypothetical protein